MPTASGNGFPAPVVELKTYARDVDLVVTDLLNKESCVVVRLSDDELIELLNTMRRIREMAAIPPELPDPEPLDLPCPPGFEDLLDLPPVKPYKPGGVNPDRN